MKGLALVWEGLPLIPALESKLGLVLSLEGFFGLIRIEAPDLDLEFVRPLFLLTGFLTSVLSS